MAQCLTDEWIDFLKIRYWESCQTAEVEWEEFKDENGEVKRMPYTKALERLRMATVYLPTSNRPETGWNKFIFCMSKREWAGCRHTVARRMDNMPMKPVEFASRN
jgi:hypothetical protein